MIEKWLGLTPESEGLYPEEFDRLVRKMQSMKLDYTKWKQTPEGVKWFNEQVYNGMEKR